MKQETENNNDKLEGQVAKKNADAPVNTNTAKPTSAVEDEDDYIATPEEIAAEAKRQAERRNQRKGTQSKRGEEDEEEAMAESGARPDDIVDPYAEPDPQIPWVKYEENAYLMRGCNHCPKCYEPIAKWESNSCSKLSTHNWMASIRQPAENRFNIVEVRFKNNRKDFFRLPDGLSVVEGDLVAVEGMPGHDVGIVSLTGEVCRLRMRDRNIDPNSENIRKLYRRAKSTDIEKWVEAIKEENNAVIKTRMIAEGLGLAMKVNDVEMQGDHSKAIFYYTADERVDFRTLIKVLAEEFHVRVEMKQIGVRQEAAKVGGIGTCGRELCCSTWLTNFKTVTTSAAKMQQILPNPQKLAGQCGKLKCCLNFEYEVYADALKKFPPTGVAMRFKKGLALYKKIDVFRGIMWYAYEGEGDLHAIPAESVKKIIEMNREQKYPEQLEDFQVELMSTSALEQETSNDEFERELRRMAEGGNGVVEEEKKSSTPRQADDNRRQGERQTQPNGRHERQNDNRQRNTESEPRRNGRGKENRSGQRATNQQPTGAQKGNAPEHREQRRGATPHRDRPTPPTQDKRNNN